MFTLRNTGLLLITVMTLGLASGCKSFDEKKLARANEKLEAARTEGAPDYAPELFKSAEEAYNEAVAIKDDSGDVNKYERRLDESLQKSAEAMAKTVTAKNREAAQNRIAEAEEAINGLNPELAGRHAAADQQAANDSLTSAREAFESEDYVGAESQASNSIAAVARANRAIQAATAPRATTPVTRTSTPAAGSGGWSVNPGDCLWCIARKPAVYNDPFQWPLIYKANRDQIRNPDRIYPNQNFAVPRSGVSMSDIRDARREAGAARPYDPPASANAPR